MQRQSFLGLALISVLTIAALTLFVQAAFAVGLDITKIPKVRTYDDPPVASFLKAAKTIEESQPYDDPLLSYNFKAPRDWSKNLQQPPLALGGGERALSDSVLEILGRYTSAPRNLLRSNIVVEAQRMSYEISAVSWFVNFIVSNGFSLTSLTVHSPRALDAVYIQVDNDVPYIVRVKLVINGPRLILARYYLPQDNYEEEKVTQARVMDSFTMTNMSKDGIEKRETYGFLDQSYFDFPESWILREKSILSIERMGATLYQESRDDGRSVLEGHIKIVLVSKLLDTTLPKEIETFRKGLVIKNYKIGPLIQNVVYQYDRSIRTGKAQLYKLIPNDPVRMKSYELLVTAMQGDDYYYITSMITPAREQDYYQWARNMEAARIVNESIRRSNASLVYDPNDPYFDYMKDAKAR